MSETSNVVPRYDYSFDDLLAKCYDLAKKERGIQIEVGLILLELRERIEAGEKGQVKWWAWYEENLLACRSRSYAESVMALAQKENPQKALEERRQADRERKRKPKLTVVQQESEPTQPESGEPSEEPSSIGGQWKKDQNSRTKTNRDIAPQQEITNLQVETPVAIRSTVDHEAEDNAIISQVLAVSSRLTYAGWNRLFVQLRQQYRAKFGGK